MGYDDLFKELSLIHIEENLLEKMIAQSINVICICVCVYFIFYISNHIYYICILF
jgi:hypothetical protein